MAGPALVSSDMLSISDSLSDQTSGTLLSLSASETEELFEDSGIP